MSYDLRSLFQVGVDILTTFRNGVTNKILAQTGHVVGEVADGDNVEWWQHVGFASRPSKPDKGKAAAQAVVMRRGDHDVAFASQDVRGTEIYGNLDHGETCVYGPGIDGKAQGRVIWKKDGSVNIFTTDDNTKDGRSVYFRVAPNEFVFVAPWGKLTWDPTGLHASHASGASMNMGGIGGMPAPLDQLSSYFSVQAGMISQTAAIQANGSGAGSSLASAPGVDAAIDALQAQVALLQAAIIAFATPATNPGITAADALNKGAGLLAAAGTGAAVFITAVEAAKLAIPTSTTSS